MHGSINGRYAGTKLSSFNYNFGTASGSVGPAVQLPIQPVNALGNGINSKGTPGFRVAPEFLDGSTTSSFDQTLLGEGKPSWGGDSRQYSGSATVDKHPIYMARFENSYEQLNLYNSYQYNIDQLIEIPFESIAGQEITPNSITIDGSNESKKVVSAAFEPKRKTSVSYLNPKTRTVDYTQMQVGNFNILSGATEFLTLNSNAKSRTSSSLAYQYTLGGIPPIENRVQVANTIQMVTGSNTQASSTFDDGRITLGVLTTTTTPAPTTDVDMTISPATLLNVPLDSLGGAGSGALATVVFTGISTGGTYQSTTITFGGQGYSNGATLQITTQNLQNALINAGYGPRPGNKGVTVSDPLNFTLATSQITFNANLETSFGFLLSGSLTTDTLKGGNTGANIMNTASIGDLYHPINTTIDPNIYLPISYNASPIGTYTDLATTTTGLGVGMTVDVVVADGVPNLVELSVNAVNGAPINETYITSVGPNLTPPGLGTGMTVKYFINSGGTISTDTDSLGQAIIQIANPGSGYDVGAVMEIRPGANSTSPTFGTQGACEVLNVQTAISSVTANKQGSGYRVGDVIIISKATLTEAGIVISGDNDTDYTSTVLLNGQLSPLNQPYSVNFNPSPISSSTVASNFTSPTVPENIQLLVGGPQLAVHHMYNTTVSSSFYEINPPQLAPTIPGTNDIGPTTTLWTTSGSEAGNVENYMIWNPEGSDSTSYQNTNTPFLIERGDIIRVEGLLNTINSANISQSTAVIEDFTVEEIQNYFYTSSFSKQTPLQARDGLTGVISFLGNINQQQVIVRGYAGNPSGVTNSFGQSGTVIIGQTFGVTSNLGNTSGATIQLNVLSGGGNWVAIVLGDSVSLGTAGNSFTAGEEITIDVSALVNGSNWTNQTVGNVPTIAGGAKSIVIAIGSSNLINTGFNNDFTFGVNIDATANLNAGTEQTGSQGGYHNYEKGEVGFSAPTFIRVSPNPTEVLNGLEDGAITKMTVRRQIEADDRIMLENITPPSGSRGVATPSGQGFLIPNDFSKVQKSNALNIINQLKAKNAFDKPIEPGITKD